MKKLNLMQKKKLLVIQNITHNGRCQLLYLFKFQDKLVCLKDYCKLKCISYAAVHARRQKTNQSYEEILAYYETPIEKRQNPPRIASSYNLVTLNGEVMSVREYCKRKGWCYATIQSRKHRNPNKSYEEIFAEYELNPPKEKIGVKDYRLYNIWHGMLQRCYNSKHPNFKHYGGKFPTPIHVIDSWHDYKNFEIDMYNSYIEHVKEYGEKDTTLDRYDNNTDYCLANCHQATIAEQNTNKKRKAYKYILASGESVKDYCRDNNINYQSVVDRIKKGWSADDAVHIPMAKHKS